MQWKTHIQVQPDPSDCHCTRLVLFVVEVTRKLVYVEQAALNGQCRPNKILGLASGEPELRCVAGLGEQPEFEPKRSLSFANHTFGQRSGDHMVKAVAEFANHSASMLY